MNEMYWCGFHIKNQRWTNSFKNIHDDMLLSLLLNQIASTLKLKIKKASTNSRIRTLKPCSFTKFDIIAHVLVLTTHCSYLSFPHF